MNFQSSTFCTFLFFRRKRKPAEQQKDTQTEDCVSGLQSKFLGKFCCIFMLTFFPQAFSSDCVIRIEKGKVMLKQLAEPKEVLMVSNIEELLDRVPGYHGLFIVMLKAPGKGYQKANAVYLGRAGVICAFTSDFAAQPV